uniref:Uncharacterized protein n=1 Tax=Cynoglossus semilaevis TaxID=244447 RepID=A0A3P8W1N0_CYNSE
MLFAVNNILSKGEDTHTVRCNSPTRADRQGKMPRLVDAFCARAAIQTELQVLGGVRPDLPGGTICTTETMDGVSTAHSAIIKSSREVVCHGLVDPLVCAALEGFEDDGDLWTDRQRRVLESLCSKSV